LPAIFFFLHPLLIGLLEAASCPVPLVLIASALRFVPAPAFELLLGSSAPFPVFFGAMK
jgi:hypothetical protein